MVPARLTGKPFWDVYVYRDPPIWKAQIDALKRFDIDGGFELNRMGPVDVFFPPDAIVPTEERVVKRFADGSFVTQSFHRPTERWAPNVIYYTAGNPPGINIHPSKFGLPDTPTEWEPITGVKQWPRGMELWKLIRQEMGDQGIVGLNSGMSTSLINNPEAIYAYYDDPTSARERSRQMLERVEQRMELISAMDPKPDFLFCGGSGTLIWQTPDIVRELVLPVLKRTTEMAKDLGIPTQVHSCGPERELVKMAALETELTIIDPLEVPPMGDCDLAELKRLYGNQIVLKGNLHTTEVMLKGSVDEVRAASRQAINDAGAGGGFILSTGDQCGRDTPDENILAMIETARTYGRY